MNSTAMARRVRARIEPRGTREHASVTALRTIAGATRAGRSFEHAVADAARRSDGTVGAALHDAAARMALGVTPARAIRSTLVPVDPSTFALLADVVDVQRRTGGDIGAICNRLARLMQERMRLAGEVRSLTAQARFTARAVLVMPIVAAVLWLWVAPGSFARMLTPATMLLAVPSIGLMIVGTIVIRRLATSGPGASAHRPHGASVSTRLMRRIVGTGSNMSRSARGALPGIVLLAGAVAAVATGAGVSRIIVAFVALGGGAAWPVLDDRRARRHIGDVADAGVCTLLEVSIALLAAGASPSDVIAGALDAAPGELGGALAPARAHIALGRAPGPALRALDVVHESPELDAWCHALTEGARQGAPATDVLEGLLRDARARERERVRSHASVTGPRIQLAVVICMVPAVTWLVLVATATGLAAQLSGTGLLAAP